LADQIIFEHPLNEKCRTLLRLSHLFEQFEHHLALPTEWSSRAALAALLDIAAVLARADIKSELIKESDRYVVALSKMADKRGVDRVRLEQILGDVQAMGENLQRVQGQLGHALRSNDFLKAVVQRSSIPGGSFDFDLPQLHYWLQQDHAERVMQLDSWRQEVAAVQDAVELLVSLIRNSATARNEHAIAGFYQRTLSGSAYAQMVRVTLPAATPLFAEISGSKHRFSIRFMESSDVEHPMQTPEDVAFLLTTCSL
jgi:cell division protein ZapD